MSKALLRNLTSKNPRMVRGEGIYLFDAEGRRYIDGTSGSAWSATSGMGSKRSPR